LKVRVAVQRDGRLLCARHERRGEAFWCLPGGGVEPGEGAEAAAVRELQEEAGLEVELEGVVWVTDDSGRRFDADGQLELVFRGRVAAGEAHLAEAGDRSLVAIAWFGVDDLPGDFRPPALARRIAEAGGVAALPAIPVSPWK
jgi:8-oxo-dGTP diphosphatase